MAPDSSCFLGFVSSLELSSPKYSLGFPGGSDSKEFACSAGDPGLIPGLGRSPEEGNGSPVQYSCLEKPTYQKEPGSHSSFSHSPRIIYWILDVVIKCGG